MKFVLVKAELASATVSQIGFEAESDAAEGEVGPGNVVWGKQSHLQAFLASLIIRGPHLPAVEKMYLVDVGDADNGEGSVDIDVGAGFLYRFPARGVGGGFTIFHEASR